MDELEKMEIAKTRPILKNTWYQCYDWLINHFWQSMKKSASNTNQTVMRLFESKLDNNMPTDYKPRKIRDVFEGRYVEYKTEKDQNLSMAKYLEKDRSHLHDTINDLQKFGE